MSLAVKDCASYSDNGVCRQCKEGFIFSQDQKSCITPPTITNCGQYTYIKCNACSEQSSVANPNLFFLVNLSSSNYLPALLSQLKLKSQSSSWVGPAMCQPTKLTNCQKLSSATNCA